MRGNLLKVSIAIFVLLGASALSACTTTGQVTRESGPGDGEVLRIPRSEITAELDVRTYDADGVEVRFMVVEDQDGEVRTAFDACDFCGGRLGYEQVGQEVECRNCGQRFRIDQLGEANLAGGCWPSFLSHEIEDDEVLIPLDEIHENAYRFG